MRFTLKRVSPDPGRAGSYTYGPARIWISGPVGLGPTGRTWWATVKFRHQEKDFDARSLDDVLRLATDWVDTAPELARADNPVGSGWVLAALATAGLAWLLLRPKKASAATPTPVELPSFVPSSSTPAPAPVSAAPKLPPLNCDGKVRVTYKFKNSPLLLNVYRRLTIWSASGGTPDMPLSTIADRVWAPTTATSFFNVGALDEQGWLNPTKLENDLKDAQTMSATKRYLAEAWIETADGWCLAATSTNYEAWV